MILRIADAICWAITFWAAFFTDNLIYGCAFLFVALVSSWHFWHPSKAAKGDTEVAA